MRALDTREQQDGERCAPRSLHGVRQHISSGSPFEPTIGFSRAVRHEQLVFVSATAAIWPDGHVDPDVGVQARRCLEIIDEALRESGATLGEVVRTRVFLVDAAHGDAVAQVHGEAFGRIRPASSFIVVQGFLDPRWLVEIEVDAVVGS
jgi:enamine deaminase RidA (YjgF/YER057c/UK114 family)